MNNRTSPRGGATNIKLGATRYLPAGTYLWVSRYAVNGRLALEARNAFEERELVLTVNTPEFDYLTKALMLPNLLVIKDYSENEGVIDMLEDRKIIQVRGIGTIAANPRARVGLVKLTPWAEEKVLEVLDAEVI